MFLSEPGRTDYDINFSLFGFPIRVHPAFFILPVFLGRGLISDELNTGVGILLVLVIFFLSILVHELGHAIAFAYYGVPSRIVLYWMGGLAIPDSGNVWSSQSNRRGLRPGQQIVVSLAGPIFGFLLAAVFCLVTYLLGGHLIINRLNFIPLPQPSFIGTSYENQHALFMFMWSGIIVNIVLNLFNLVPIYPLDGGQVARQTMLQMDPQDGMRNSIYLSIIACVMMVVFSVAMKASFMAVFFGFMAWTNYQSLQQYRGPKW